MAYNSKVFSFYLTVCPPRPPPQKKTNSEWHMTAKFGTHVIFMLFYSLTGSYFNNNHRIDSRGDSRHIIIVRIKLIRVENQQVSFQEIMLVKRMVASTSNFKHLKWALRYDILVNFKKKNQTNKTQTTGD